MLILNGFFLPGWLGYSQGSVLFGETKIPSGFITYFAKNQTTKVFLRDATEVVRLSGPLPNPRIMPLSFP